MARHFQDNVYAHPTVELADVVDRRRRRGEDGGRAHPLRQLAPVGVGLDAIDGRRTLRPRDADGAKTDGAEPADHHGVVFQRTGRGGMDGVAEWLLQGGDLRAQPARGPPAVLRGQQPVAGKGLVAILVEPGARTGSGFEHGRHGRHGVPLSGGLTRVLRWEFDQEGVMRAYVLINASAGKAIEVAKSLQGVKGIELADAITGEYAVIAAVEAPDVAGIGSVIVEKIQKIDGVFKTVTCLAVR